MVFPIWTAHSFERRALIHRYEGSRTFQEAPILLQAHFQQGEDDSVQLQIDFAEKFHRPMKLLAVFLWGCEANLSLVVFLLFRL